MIALLLVSAGFVANMSIAMLKTNQIGKFLVGKYCIERVENEC